MNLVSGDEYDVGRVGVNAAPVGGGGVVVDVVALDHRAALAHRYPTAGAVRDVTILDERRGRLNEQSAAALDRASLEYAAAGVGAVGIEDAVGAPVGEYDPPPFFR